MSQRYLVEVIQESITPYTVEAESERDALEKVGHRECEEGDTFYVSQPSFTVKRLDS